MERKLNQLSLDELYSIAVMLDYDDLLNFCLSDDRFNNVICNRDTFWQYKLNTDFPDYKKRIMKPTTKETYEYLHNLVNIIKSIVSDFYILLSTHDKYETALKIITKIKSLEKYGYLFDESLLKPYLTNYHSNTNKDLNDVHIIFMFSHILDNSDNKFNVYGRPIYSIKQFLSDRGIYNIINLL